MKRFKAGEVISATEMNNNFSELESNIRALNARNRAYIDVPLAMGWENVGRKKLAIKEVHGVVYLSGIVRRKAGGSILNIATIERRLVPTQSNIVGAVSNGKYHGALHISDTGIVSIMPYGNWGSDAGWDVPINVQWAP